MRRLSGSISALTGIAAFAALLLNPMPGCGQTDQSDEARALAVADSALAAINRGDMVALTDLMLEEAFVVAIGGPRGSRDYTLRSRAQERSTVFDVQIVERGFDGEARVAGRLATVWLPYDLYVDGDWSHCGVDTFTMLEVGHAWRIASLVYTVEQPPACRRHPDGPPGD
jgi:hypothetical protein